MLNKLLRFSLIVFGICVAPMMAATNPFDLAKYSATAEIAFEEIKSIRDKSATVKGLDARRDYMIKKASAFRTKYRNFISQLLPFSEAVKSRRRDASVKRTINNVRNVYYLLAYLETSYYYRIAERAAASKKPADIAALRNAINALITNLNTLTDWAKPTTPGNEVAAGTIIISTFSYYGTLYTLYQRLVTAQDGQFDQALETKINTAFLGAVRASIKGL